MARNRCSTCGTKGLNTLFNPEGRLLTSDEQQTKNPLHLHGEIWAPGGISIESVADSRGGDGERLRLYTDLVVSAYITLNNDT